MPTRFGPSTAFTGDLTCEEDLTVDGRFNGSIQLRAATLTVGPSGELEATVHAPRVVVYGRLKGSISGGERIDLAASAVVSGDLSATQVVIADGAQFNGRVDMARRTIAAKVAQYRAAEPA